MVTRKLAAPLINEKILHQAEHCYVATSSISDAGFDFFRSRIPAKCKIEIVTGLDEPTSPNVLRRIIKHYQERITLKIYTRNVLHANLYVIDLPFRKSVAFVGSGAFSLEGFKDQEELFWKITNPKEIESLMSWFTGFYEFGLPLTEPLLAEYEAIYPSLKKREILSRKEKEMALMTATIDWDSIKFKNQYFKGGDYLAFSPVNASSIDIEIRTARDQVRQKLDGLRSHLKSPLSSQKLFPVQAGEDSELNDLAETQHSEMCFSFGKSDSGFSPGFATVVAGITAAHYFVRLEIKGGNEARKERVELEQKLKDATFVSGLFAAVSTMGAGYTLEVSGQTKPVESFQKDVALVEWIRGDFGNLFSLLLQKNFSPSDPMISQDKIVEHTTKEMTKLARVLALFV